ncbi:MAG TPA: RsmB/NOP family class I SAM-dependent RNA methyltransferase [Sphingomonas sp.]|jgi:16S rRNA (cytosine967-C5)-methyltransferase|uniref:RsmB/NOP family class I SAM-dependent RNA methyltransferase n=1 Tax=Sphingomonas sp. TaxID=28214 RepID=UPI002ED94098
MTASQPSRFASDNGPGVPARRAALKLLDAVLRQGRPLEAALAGATREVRGADRALAHMIAATVLRRMPDLDALIDGATARPLPNDAKARTALRIALAQALVLGTPPHAAIATVLPLVDGGPRKLVHGVFGTVMRSAAVLPDPPTLPADVAERWTREWGEETVRAAAAAIAAPPPLDLTLARPADTADWTERLGGESYMPGHVRLPERGAVADLPGYTDGAWWVQDVSASLPVRVLLEGRGNREPGRVLDLCAAPGGKTLQLAAAGWDVVAVDQSESRLARLRENFARCGLVARIALGDVLGWAPTEQADAVLVDAPCSATGIFRRHPDVLHRAHPRFIADMAEVQARILARAAEWVKPGGTLIYATCSLEPAEGEAQVERFLAGRGDYALDSPSVPVPVDRGAFGLRVLPSSIPGGCDGFFIARLTRNG